MIRIERTDHVCDRLQDLSDRRRNLDLGVVSKILLRRRAGKRTSWPETAYLGAVHTQKPQLLVV